MIELGEGRSEEEVLVIPWGSGQRGKGDHCRFPAPKLELELAELDLKRSRRGVVLLQPLGTGGLWVSWG